LSAGCSSDMGLHMWVAKSKKRGRGREDGNAYQLGGLSFDDELLLLQILKVGTPVSMRTARWTGTRDQRREATYLEGELHDCDWTARALQQYVWGILSVS
jgi:hypothetical protein